MYCILVILSYNVPINWPEPLCIKKQSVHIVFLHPGLSIDCFIVYWSTVKSECIVFGVLFVSYVNGNIHSNIKNDFFSQRDNLLQVTFLNLFSSEIFMSASVLFFNEYLGVVLSNKTVYDLIAILLRISPIRKPIAPLCIPRHVIDRGLAGFADNYLGNQVGLSCIKSVTGFPRYASRSSILSSGTHAYPKTIRIWNTRVNGNVALRNTLWCLWLSRFFISYQCTKLGIFSRSVSGLVTYSLAVFEAVDQALATA